MDKGFAGKIVHSISNFTTKLQQLMWEGPIHLLTLSTVGGVGWGWGRGGRGGGVCCYGVLAPIKKIQNNKMHETNQRVLKLSSLSMLRTQKEAGEQSASLS